MADETRNAHDTPPPLPPRIPGFGRPEISGRPTLGIIEGLRALWKRVTSGSR